MRAATTVTVFFSRTTQKILRLRCAACHGCTMVESPQVVKSKQTLNLPSVGTCQLLAPGSPNFEHDRVSPAATAVLYLPASSLEPLGLAFMYGELGLKLVCYIVPSFDQTVSAKQQSQVQHAKRTQALNHLPPYQPEIVRAVAREVRELDKDVSNILAPFNGEFRPSEDPATACSLLVDHLCMRRNKRCLLAYHRGRVDRLEEMCWNGQDVLDQGQQSKASNSIAAEAGHTSSLSPEEEEYVRQYSDMLSAYKGQWTDVDLTGSLVPPRDLFIDVRVLKDAWEIQTEYGYVYKYNLPNRGPAYRAT